MDFTRLKNYMDRLVSEYNVPGVDCIVYQEHEQLFRYYTGKSDIENAKEMNGNELYLIFSMTKMLTCTAALQLMEQGKFIVSDPVSKYIPEFANMKLSDEALNTLLISVLPATLTENAGIAPTNGAERDRLRASFIKQALEVSKQ